MLWEQWERQRAEGHSCCFRHPAANRGIEHAGKAEDPFKGIEGWAGFLVTLDPGKVAARGEELERRVPGHYARAGGKVRATCFSGHPIELTFSGSILYSTRTSPGWR